jgi:phosphoribosylamine--glycine ligase
MNILVIGSGAREHTIAWKLGQSPRVDALYVAPGNAGTAALGTNLDIEATDIPGMLSAAREHGIDLTFVGPEVPLAGGIVDRFQEAGLTVFGPTQAAARIESSKSFAREFMERHRIPCAEGLIFDSYREAYRFIQNRDRRLVVKVDGLAAGKGVTVAGSRQEAISALDDAMNRRIFGEAGDVVIVEEFLQGREVSVFAFTDGERISPLLAACDYKRAGDGDTGPNTGGMGSYSPPEFWDTALAAETEQLALRPAIDGMGDEGHPYKGVLYAGLMLTRTGLKVLEYNCRLGDPEAQVVLPLLETDLVELAQAVAEGNLTETEIRWSNDACVGVVVASQGYPSSYETGLPISGLDEMPADALVFHAGTRLEDGRMHTSGGRVLTVVGRAPTLSEARDRAYAALGRVGFQGAYHRTDIALRPAAPGAPRS